MASKATMGCISMKSIRSSIISLVHVTVFWSFLFSHHPCTTRVFVIIYIHKLMLIRILSSDWSISIQVPSKLKKNRMHFYSIQVVQVFWFKFLVWYTRSKNLNSRNLNGDLDAKLVSCIPGLIYNFVFWVDNISSSDQKILTSLLKVDKATSQTIICLLDWLFSCVQLIYNIFEWIYFLLCWYSVIK